MAKSILVVEAFSVDGPEQFGLVAEEVVSVESCKSVGQNGEPEIVSEQSVGLHEASELGKHRKHDVLPSELVHGEAKWLVSYIPMALTASALCCALCILSW